MERQFQFEPFSADVFQGRFTLDDALLRRAFGALNLCETAASGAETLHIYGLRRIFPDGKVENIGIMDEFRETFEALCQRFSRGEVELAALRTLVEVGGGFTVNSPQNVDDDANPFNALARQYISGLRCAPGCFPEAIDMNLFFGSYDRGFGFHRDPDDTALFVIDGKKVFEVGDTQTDTSRYEMSAGEYLRWRSVHWHSNANPTREWSVTINFAVGPHGKRMIPDGTPVEYKYADTQLNSYVDQMSAQYNAGVAG